MSKVQTLRVFVNQRLSAAAEEIIELFGRTIAEYEEELCRQRKLLEAVLKPEVQLHRTDVQLLLVSKEEDPPDQQEWSSGLDQEDPAERPHIKEEQEELWTSQEGEQLRGLEETDITRFTFTPVPVKSEEENEEKPLHLCSPQFGFDEAVRTEHLKTEVYGGSEPAANFPDSRLQPHDKTSHSSEPDTDESCDWEETREPQSHLKPLQNKELPVSVIESNAGKTSCSSSEGATSFNHKGHLQKDSGIQIGLKAFSCSVCGKRYPGKNSLKAHMRLHSEGTRFSCSICKKTFPWRGEFDRHMRIHTGEKPFSCTVCGKAFTQSSSLTSHLRVHTGEKPFSCPVCNKAFQRRENVAAHMSIHTGEKLFSCSVCGKQFTQRSTLTSHLRIHTGEKPFSCSVCEASFSRRGNLYQHMRTHSGEKPFSCSFCGKRFTRKARLREHVAVHTGEK